MGITGAAMAVDRRIKEMLAERIAAQKLEEERQATRVRDQREREEFDHRRRYQEESLASLREQREVNADLRRQNAAHVLAGDLSMNDVLDPTQASTLRAGNLGSLLEDQAPTLPSQAHSGSLTLPSATEPMRGFLRTTSNPGNPAQTVYRGTPAQRKTQEQHEALRRLVDSLPAGSPERRAAEWQLTTGQNPPAALMPRDPTPRYSLHPMYDESGEETGAGSFNTVTGELRPVPGSPRIRTPGRSTTTTGLPSRVQGFLLDLRARHATYDAALRELQQVLANAPDETFDRIDAAGKLRQLYAQPTGRAGLFGDLDLSDDPLLGSDETNTPAAAAPQGAVSRAELRAVAQQLGITEAEAASQAQARRLQIVD